MLNYMRLISPDLTEHPFLYSDTDSLHILGKHHKMLKEMEMDDPLCKREKRPALGDDLGQLNNDLKKDAVILKAIYLAPKMYAYFWLINRDGEYGWVNKTKGIPAIDSLTKEKLVTEDMFMNKERKTVEFNSLVKNHKTISKEKKAGGITHFNINAIRRKLVFNKNDWTGMKLVGDLYYPNSYEKPVITGF